MADDEDLYKGPLAERVQSKNWKVRRAAYEQLQQNFKEATDNGIFDEYGTHSIPPPTPTFWLRGN